MYYCFYLYQLQHAVCIVDVGEIIHFTSILILFIIKEIGDKIVLYLVQIPSIFQVASS